MDNSPLYIYEQWHQKNSAKFLALSEEYLQNGLLKNLTPIQICLYLLLWTKANKKWRLKINNSELFSAIPSLDSLVIKNTLEELNDLDLLAIEPTPFGYDIQLKTREFAELTADKSLSSLEQEELFLSELLSGRPVSEQELVKGLVLIVAPHRLNPSLRQEIEDVMHYFSHEIIKELIRRVKKAVEENPDLKPIHYFRSIVKKWVEAEITSYEDLQELDRLHRETTILAAEFGLNRVTELTPTHRKTLSSWITQTNEEDHALSLDVACYAIQKAVKSKKDSRPSLNYVENNYIKPWKKLKVSSIEEVNMLSKSKKTSTKIEDNWDYEEFLDN